MTEILSLLSAVSFFAFPILVGRALLTLFGKNKDSEYSLISYFIFGSLLIYGLVLFERYVILPIIPALSFSALFFPLVNLLVFASLLINFVFPAEISKQSLKKYIVPVFLSLSLAIFGYFIFLFRSPNPLNWDLYEHQTLINLIKTGNFSFVTSQISDTFLFNGYSSIFHLLLSISQQIKLDSFLNFWQVVTFIHYFLSILASYLFAQVVTKNKTIAFISAILGAFIFESNVVYTSLIFIPQTFTAVFFILTLSQLLKTVESGKHANFLFLLPTITFLLLNHYVIGSLASFILVAIYLYYHNNSLFSQKFVKAGLLLDGLLFILALIFAPSFVSLDFLNRGEARFYNFDLVEKLIFALNTYGFSMFIFLPLGMFLSFWQKRKEELNILVLTIFILALVIVQLPYVLKFYVIGRFFVHLFMAIGAVWLLELIENKLLRNIAMSIFVIILITIYTTNIIYWKNILTYKNQFGHFSSYDKEAALYLKANYKEANTLLISDPGTQYILEALSGVNSQGGAYASIFTRTKLDKISTSGNPVEIAQELYKIIDNLNPNVGKRVFVLSGRYFLWQNAGWDEKSAFAFNIWAPEDLAFSNYKFVQLLTADTNSFTIKYQNPGVVILEAKKI